MNAWLTVAGRWAFVERVVGGALASLDTLLENSVALPVGENLLFEIRHAQFVGYRFEHPANVARAKAVAAFVAVIRRCCCSGTAGTVGTGKPMISRNESSNRPR